MNLSLEWSLYAKVKSLDSKCSTFNGLTSFEERRETMRGTIKNLGPDILYTVKDGKQITLAQQWTKVYEKDWT